LILRAAAEELAHVDTARDFTISALARRAGLAKGTVYLYFNNKGAILRALLADAIEGLLNDICAKVNKLTDPVNAPKMAGAIRDALKNSATSRRLVRLLRGLSQEPGPAREAFRTRIYPLLAQADATIVRRLPTLRPGQGQEIMQFSWALLLGLSEFAGTKPKSSRRPGKVAPRSVDESLGQALTLIIEGYLSRSR
jgi:AcrR family transcriptional regulator